MSQNQIKWLAVVLMLIDHVGFLIEAEPMRIIGRLSFPMFAWVFARNWERRKAEDSAERLINRLILFGFLAQIPYILLLTNLRMNILISFALIAVTFNQVRKLTGNKKIVAVIIGCISAEILGVDYGWYAVACPLLMINLKGKGNRVWWISWIITNTIYAATSGYFLQVFAILTPLILAYHNPARDRKPTAIEKKFFYYFYPIHLAGLAALRTIL